MRHLALLSLAVVGCARSYFVPDVVGDELRKLSVDERRNVALPAVRAGDGASVFVRGSEIQLDPLAAAPPGRTVALPRTDASRTRDIGLVLLGLGGAAIAGGAATWAHNRCSDQAADFGLNCASGQVLGEVFGLG